MAISTEGKIGIVLALLGLLGTGIVFVAPETARPVGWVLIGVAGLGLAGLGAHHFRDLWGRRKQPGEGMKMLSFVGMVICLIAATGFGAWHFWPKAQAQPVSTPTSHAEFRMAISGANIFTPDARPELTGVALDARIWNLAAPSAVTQWGAKAHLSSGEEIAGQVADIPATLVLKGPLPAVLYGSESLTIKTESAPVGGQPVLGKLLIYFAAPRAALLDPKTRISITAEDQFGFVSSNSASVQTIEAAASPQSAPPLMTLKDSGFAGHTKDDDQHVDLVELNRKIDTAGPILDEWSREHPGQKLPLPPTQALLDYINDKLAATGVTWRLSMAELRRWAGGLVIGMTAHTRSGVGVEIEGGGHNSFEGSTISGGAAGVRLKNTDNNSFTNSTISGGSENHMGDVHTEGGIVTQGQNGNNTEGR